MNSLKSALKLLAKGEFVCQVRFESEYEALATPEGQQQAQECGDCQQLQGDAYP